MRIKTQHFLLIITSLIFLYSCADAQVKKEYYENGNIKSITKYKDGVKSGEEKTYYSNGELAEKFIYVNNKKNGPFSIYYDNGKLENIGTFKNGELDGITYSFTEAKDTIFIREHDNGKTLYDIRYENNKPLRIMDFRKQQMIVYNPDGTVKDTVNIKKR